MRFFFLLIGRVIQIDSAVLYGRCTSEVSFKPWPDECRKLLWALDELSEALDCICIRAVPCLRTNTDLLDVLLIEKLLQKASPRCLSETLAKDVG